MFVRTARLVILAMTAATAVFSTIGADDAMAQVPLRSSAPGTGAVRQSNPNANGNGVVPAQQAQQVVPQNGGAMLPNGQQVPPQNLQLPPPFMLTPQQQAQLDELLTKWEKKNDEIKLFKCSFYRWEYDPAFINNPKQTKAEASGEVEYAAPDKGLFHDLQTWDCVPNQQGKFDKVQAEQGMYWTCDGNSVYEVDPKRKVITEKPLPPQLRGKAISEGPLPFVFGAKAGALKARYYLRIVEDANLAQNNQVLLEAYPKWQKDAGNFSHVELILDAKELLPVALQVFNPGANLQQQSRTVIKFDHLSINKTWDKLQNLFNDFSKPNILGYTHQVEPTPMPPPANPPQLTNGAKDSMDQAQRPQALKR